MAVQVRNENLNQDSGNGFRKEAQISEVFKSLMKDQDRLDIGIGGETEGMMTPGFLTWVSNQADRGTINTDRAYRRWSRFWGECYRYCRWAHLSPNPMSNLEARKVKYLLPGILCR